MRGGEEEARGVTTSSREIPEDLAHRLDRGQVPPVAPARVGEAEETVLLKEGLPGDRRDR